MVGEEDWFFAPVEWSTGKIISKMTHTVLIGMFVKPYYTYRKLQNFKCYKVTTAVDKKQFEILPSSTND